MLMFPKTLTQENQCYWPPAPTDLPDGSARGLVVDGPSNRPAANPDQEV